MPFSFKNSTKNKVSLDQKLLKKIKEEILGEIFVLSLNLIGDNKSKKLNLTYRNGNYIPNVLSFPIDKKMGEIFINPNQAQKECSDFNLSHKNFIYYLFIHGCLHLKGLEHGKKMDITEQKLLKKYSLEK